MAAFHFFRFALLVALCSVAFSKDVRKANDCLVKRIMQTGVGYRNALHYGDRLEKAWFTEDYIMVTLEPITAFVMNSSRAHARALKSCIGGKLKSCKGKEPCRNGGKCVLNHSKRSYLCECHKDYGGPFCRTPHPAPVLEFRQLQKTVKTELTAVKTALTATSTDLTATKKALSSTRTALSSTRTELATMKKRLAAENTCPRRSKLGYKYNSGYHRNLSGKRKLVSIRLYKKLPQTLLHVSYKTSLGVQTAGTAIRLYVLFDGKECSRPTKMDSFMYHNSGNGWIIVPTLVNGFCGRTSGGGAIGKGWHTVSVHMGKDNNHQFPKNTLADYYSTAVLEVKEVCPPF